MTPHKIALELNMMSSELKEESLVNEDLKNALDLAEYNRKQKKMDELEEFPTAEIKRIMYENYRKELSTGSDNEIIVSYV